MSKEVETVQDEEPVLQAAPPEQLTGKEFFKIRHPVDHSRTYDLWSYERFQEIYEPQGYTIISGNNRQGVKERIAYLEAQRAALQPKEENDAGTSDNETTEQDEKPSDSFIARHLHSKSSGKNS